MATINKINSNIPIQLTLGGTQTTSFTSEGVVYYDGTELNSVAGTVAGTAWTSAGSGSAPFFVALPTFFPVVAGDPASPSVGDTWYNSVSNEFRGCVNGGGSGVWVVKANMNTGVYDGAGAGSSGASSLSMGGQVPNSVNTQLYTGISDSWSTQSNLNTNHIFPAGAGTSSDAVCLNGSNGSACEKYNGTSWSLIANSPQSVVGQSAAGAGSSSVLAMCGSFTGPAVNNVYLYNGGSNSWSTLTGTSIARLFPSGDGIPTNAMCAGGIDNSNTAVNSSETFNGTSWTTAGTFTTGRQGAGGAGSTGSSSLTFGGSDNIGPNVFNSTEVYSSGSWSSGPTMNVARYYQGSCGNISDALSFGGRNQSTAPFATTERLNGSTPTNVTFILT